MFFLSKKKHKAFTPIYIDQMDTHNYTIMNLNYVVFPLPSFATFIFFLVSFSMAARIVNDWFSSNFFDFRCPRLDSFWTYTYSWSLLEEKGDGLDFRSYALLKLFLISQSVLPFFSGSFLYHFCNFKMSHVFQMWLLVKLRELELILWVFHFQFSV